MRVRQVHNSLPTKTQLARGDDFQSLRGAIARIPLPRWWLSDLDGSFESLHVLRRVMEGLRLDMRVETVI